jgi:hypothetical protein
MSLEVISLELQSAEQAECSGITRKRRSGAEGKDLEWMTHSKNQDEWKKKSVGGEL